MSKRTNAPQEKILNFIETYHTDHFRPPTVREIQREMGYKSPRAVSYFLEKMERDNLIVRKARSRGVFLRKLITSSRKTCQIPFYEMIRQELGEEKDTISSQLTVDVEALGLDPNGTYYAMKVVGQGMVCAGVFEGDTVILEAKRDPSMGDIVAIMDGEETKLLRYTLEADAPILKSENFHDPYTKAFQAKNMKGVLVSLIRNVRPKNTIL